MNIKNDNPNIRKGKFLWRKETERAKYIENLSKKISSGFYTSDKIINKLVEDMAPVFNDAAEYDTAY